MILFSTTSYWLYLFILLVNTILSFIKGYERKILWLKILSFYSLGLLIIQIASDVTAYFTSDNLYFSHIYFYFQFVTLGIFYHHLFRKYPKQQKFIRIYIILTTIYLLIYYLIDPTMWFVFNLSEIILTNYLLIVCSLMYNYNTLSKKRLLGYFNIGVVSYSILSASLFLYGNVVSKVDYSSAVYVWALHFLALIFFQVMIFTQLIQLFYFRK